MRKLSILILFAFLFLGHNLTAQDIYISPNPVFTQNVMFDDFEGVGHSLFYNEDEDAFNFTWEIVVIEMTEGWNVAVCDVVQCYLPTVSTQPFDLGAGQSGTMDVHVYPNGVDGAAIIQVDVFQTNDTTNITSATYFFNHSVGVAEKFSEAIKVYPNPTQDFVTIDNYENRVAAVELYNVSGKLVLRSDLNGSDRISLQELTSGNYILKLVDENANIVSTNLIVKQ